MGGRERGRQERIGRGERKLEGGIDRLRAIKREETLRKGARKGQG